MITLLSTLLWVLRETVLLAETEELPDVVQVAFHIEAPRIDGDPLRLAYLAWEDERTAVAMWHPVQSWVTYQNIAPQPPIKPSTLRALMPSGWVGVINVFADRNHLGTRWDIILPYPLGTVNYELIFEVDTDYAYFQNGSNILETTGTLVRGTQIMLLLPGLNHPNDGVARVLVDGDLAFTFTPTELNELTVGIDGNIYHNPVVMRNDDISVPLDTITTTVEGIEAFHGFTEDLPIPASGIEMISRIENLRDTSTTGERFDKIGVAHLEYRIRDADSLGNQFINDRTYALTERKISVITDAKPTLQIYYANTARNRDNELIALNTLYDSELEHLSCGGESGWTNQPLVFSVNNNSIAGTYATTLTLAEQIVMTENMTVERNILMPPNIVTTMQSGSFQSSEEEGTDIVAFLSEQGDATNILSAFDLGKVKIDTTPPEVRLEYLGGYAFKDESRDFLSGMSVEHPTQIAFMSSGSDMTVPSDAWEELDNHTMSAPGHYDVWVRVIDKAGNVTQEKVFEDFFVGGEVSIVKNTIEGAAVHVWNCPYFEGMETVACEEGCHVSGRIEVVAATEFAYELKITNTALIGNAVGTFEDYLPQGVLFEGEYSIATSGDAVAAINSELLTMGTYNGRYRVWGSYSDLAPGEQIDITIYVRAPIFNKTSAESNVIWNQASTDWTIGAGAGQIAGSTLSNYANQQVIKPLGVETAFIKVGNDNPTLGLANAEFTLYRWEGDAALTLEERNHMVDIGVLADDTLPGGVWRRVKYDGEDANALTDVFRSSILPAGRVDLGNLPEGVYTLIETKAPSGYELPIGQWILTIDPANANTGENDWTIEFEGKSRLMMPPAVARDTNEEGVAYRLINARPFSIGLSGLGGTKGLLLIGFVFMAIAANTYLVCDYRKSF
jgi:Predicted outer membrane protein